MGPLEFLYVPDERDRKEFGENYQPPKRFEHGKEYVVATFTADEKSDGQTTEICEARWPARFLSINVLPGQNSINEPQAGYRVGFGSGMVHLAVTVAEQISLGMIGFDPL